MIKPTVGRVVWAFRPFHTGDVNQPETAQIVYVHNDRLVNIAGFNHDGVPFKHRNVVLVQEGDPKPDGENFVTWMPFQVGQAKAQAAAPQGEGSNQLSSPVQPLTAANMVVHPTQPPNPPDPVPPPPGG